MIDTLMQLGDLFLHIDRHLDVVIAQYGYWAYGFLFAIVFAETGLVVAPFLPGDSLLFIAGAYCATGHFNIVTLSIGLVLAVLEIELVCGFFQSTQTLTHKGHYPVPEE